jgi:hypothetical protein
VDADSEKTKNRPLPLLEAVMAARILGVVLETSMFLKPVGVPTASFSVVEAGTPGRERPAWDPSAAAGPPRDLAEDVSVADVSVALRFRGRVLAVRAAPPVSEASCCMRCCLSDALTAALWAGETGAPVWRGGAWRGMPMPRPPEVRLLDAAVLEPLSLPLPSPCSSEADWPPQPVEKPPDSWLGLADSHMARVPERRGLGVGLGAASALWAS